MALDPIRLGLLASGAAAAVAASGLLLAHRVGRGRGGPMAALPSLAAGWTAGYLVMAGVPKGPPVDSWQWLLPAALAGLALGVLEFRWTGAPAPARWGFRLALAGAMAWCTVFDHRPAATLLSFAGLAAVMAAFDLAGSRADGVPFLGTVVLTAGATAVSLVIGGFMRAGPLAGALAAAAGAVGLVALRFPATARGSVPLLGLLLGGLCLNGVLYADLPVASAVLLGASPLGAWVPMPRAMRRPALARLALVALVAGAGIAVAKALTPPLDY